MIFLNLVTLAIFSYIVYIKVVDMMKHKKDENTFYRFLFTIFNIVLAVNVVALMLKHLGVVTEDNFDQILSWSFLIWGLISLKANTNFFERLIAIKDWRK